MEAATVAEAATAALEATLVEAGTLAEEREAEVVNIPESEPNFTSSLALP